MKHTTAIHGNSKSNGKYLLWLILLCGLVPHGMLSLLRLASLSDRWSPAEVENYANFFVCQWIPFWLTYISFLRLQKTDHISPLPSLCAAVLVLTFLPRFNKQAVMTIGLTLPVLVVMELSGLLKAAEASSVNALAEIGKNRGILRAFCYWSVVFLLVVHLSCKACTFPTTVASPFLMFPFPGILLFDVFRQQKKQPPGIRCIFIMLLLIPLSLYLAAVGPMEPFKTYHLMSMATGYAFLFLMLIVYNLDQWKKKAG